MKYTREKFCTLVIATAFGVAISVAAPLMGTSSAWALTSVNNSTVAGATASNTPAPTAAAAAPSASPAAAPDGNGGDGKPQGLVLALIGALGLIGLIALAFTNAALGRTKTWSLSNALSEEVNMPLKDAQGEVMMANGAPVLAPTMVASSSRLIALYGLFAILLLYVGMGAIVLYDMGTGHALPAGLGQAQSFLVSGLTLFAPYLVNQFAGVFSNFAPK